MMEQAFYTAIFTLSGAVILFMISELLRGLVIQPALKIRAETGEIIDKVIYHSAILTSLRNTRQYNEVKGFQIELRTLAARYRASERTMLFHDVIAITGIIPRSKDVDKVCICLIKLSDSAMKLSGLEYQILNEANSRTITELEKALKLRKGSLAPNVMIEV